MGAFLSWCQRVSPGWGPKQPLPPKRITGEVSLLPAPPALWHVAAWEHVATATGPWVVYKRYSVAPAGDALRREIQEHVARAYSRSTWDGVTVDAYDVFVFRRHASHGEDAHGCHGTPLRRELLLFHKTRTCSTLVDSDLQHVAQANGHDPILASFATHGMQCDGTSGNKGRGAYCASHCDYALHWGGHDAFIFGVAVAMESSHVHAYHAEIGDTGFEFRIKHPDALTIVWAARLSLCARPGSVDPRSVVAARVHGSMGCVQCDPERATCHCEVPMTHVLHELWRSVHPPHDMGRACADVACRRKSS